MHDMSFRNVTTPKDVGIEQRKILGQKLNERYKNSIEANKRYGIDIEGIIVKGSTHSRIFDVNETPASRHLIEQIIKYYNFHKQFDPKDIGCCENIDESYQESREKRIAPFNRSDKLTDASDIDSTELEK